jgi:hypothetical protein
MKALRIYAGPKRAGTSNSTACSPADIGVVPGAAGGPKGLILGALDRFIFGDWLAKTDHPVHLVGASIGAWRMATACLNDPAAGFARLERDYIHQHYELQPGQKRPTADFVSEQFGQSLKEFYGGRVHEVLQHPRYGCTSSPHAGATCWAANTSWPRRWATWAPSSPTACTARPWAPGWSAWCSPRRRRAAVCHQRLPHAPGRPQRRQLQARAAGQLLDSVCAALGAQRARRPPGAYWDGGITDYHLHLNYAYDRAWAGRGGPGAVPALPEIRGARLAGQGPQVAPQGHALPRQHGAAGARPGLDQTKAAQRQAAGPHGLRALRAGLAGRVKAWSAATAASAQLAEEWQEWLVRPDMGQLGAL